MDTTTLEDCPICGMYMSKIYPPEDQLAPDLPILWNFQRKCENHYYSTHYNTFVSGRIDIDNYIVKFNNQNAAERIEIYLLGRNRSGFINSERVALVKNFNGIIPFSNLEELQNFLLIL